MNLDLPSDSTVQYKTTLDGDKVIDSVTYPTYKGGSQTVKFKTTMDGDRIPETGYTLDGDFNYPNKRYDY